MIPSAVITENCRICSRCPGKRARSTELPTGVSIPGLGVVLHAIAQSGDSNVLATPHVLATDNIASGNGSDLDGYVCDTARMSDGAMLASATLVMRSTSASGCVL